MWVVLKLTHQRYQRDGRHGADTQFVCCYVSHYKLTDAPVVNVVIPRFSVSLW